MVNIYAKFLGKLAGINDTIWVAMISGGFALASAAIARTRARGGKQKELAKQIKELEEINREMRHELESMKLVFRIVFNKYEQDWKQDPDKISMLKDLKEQFKI